MADTQATLQKLAEANGKIDALGVALNGVQGDITALKALIAGGATPDEVAAAIDTMSANLDAKLAQAQDIDSQTTSA